MPISDNINLRLLANSNNHKGDLFTRLMKDLFFALGYKDLQVDVAKSGREIDIQGLHKTEQRGVRAECKAHAKPIGGDVINKMRGALQAEQINSDVPLCAYVVALNGFTATAIEQESQFPPEQQAILLDNRKIVTHLIEANIVISPTTATEIAGRLAQQHQINAHLDKIELLGDNLGYLWAVYYSSNKSKTHVALIHADGTVLAKNIAQQLALKLDEKLIILTPPPTTADNNHLIEQSKQQYLNWLCQECGEIHLDGLPADADLSTFSLELEKLFVPLNLKYTIKTKEQTPEIEIAPVGQYFANHPQFSLLAKPGGGKSTLLKRIAVAYADQQRFSAVADHLPQIDYLPLLLRCRDLKTQADKPILSLINNLATMANLNHQQQASFSQLIEQQLNSGQVLLLIDGLDEISLEPLRATFASNLRTFMAMFPQIALIITSREAGYRHVASVIASSCPQVTMADFDQDDVTNLCIRWHQAVLGDDNKITEQATKLATTIWENDRVKALAENPLMLTTLLVIKRCIGELPTKRVELYRQAVEVLIRTWNTQGFAPMDLDEALAQLCFVASAMMEVGIQRVGHKQLIKWLQQAREKMPAELGYCQLSPAQFIARIEYRSSLLMRVGSDDIDGTTQYVYEFRHLTFQEYLCARGLVEYGYPECQGPQNLLEQLKPHLYQESWKQVIPLAAVMAKNKSSPLIAFLTEQLEKAEYNENEFRFALDDDRKAQQLLSQCLVDEVQIPPQQVSNAITQVGRGYDDYDYGIDYQQLVQGKFANLIKTTITTNFLTSRLGLQYSVAFYTIQELKLEQSITNHSFSETAIVEPLKVDLISLLDNPAGVNSNDMQQLLSALVSLGLVFNQEKLAKQRMITTTPQELYQYLSNLLHVLQPQHANQYPTILWAILFALNRMLRSQSYNYKTTNTTLLQLLKLAPHSAVANITNWCCDVFTRHQPLARDSFNLVEQQQLTAYFEQLTQLAASWQFQPLNNALIGVKLMLAWYRCFDLSDEQLIAQIEEYLKEDLLFEDIFTAVLQQLKAAQ